MDVKSDKDKDRNRFLRPPTPTKQFLISPPASPPVGWVPCEEQTPILNYDLIHAINKLAPGEAHELHPQSEEHPGIVVHICEDQDNNLNKPTILIEDQDSLINKSMKVKILQTRAPDSFLNKKNP